MLVAIAGALPFVVVFVLALIAGVAGAFLLASVFPGGTLGKIFGGLLGFFGGIIVLLLVLGLLLSAWTALFGNPVSVAPPPQPAASSAPVPAFSSNTARNPAAGTTYRPFPQMLLTATGSGAIARFESTIPWIVPNSTSADLGGKKYLGGETVPAGYGTFFDVDRWLEIVPASVVIDTNRYSAVQPTPRSDVGQPPCTLAQIKSLPGISAARILNAADGQVEVTFSGPFTTPNPFVGDFDWMGHKFTTAGATIQASAGDTATLWLVAQCKPAR